MPHDDPAVLRIPFLMARLTGTLALASCSFSTQPDSPAQPEFPAIFLEAVTATTVTGTVGQQVDPAPVIRAVLADGSPVAGAVVAFQAANGGAVAFPRVRTSQDGTATVGLWVLGPAAGTQTLTASREGHIVMFTALAGPGPVARITRLTGNYQSGLTGSALPAPLQVIVADAFGNRIAGVPVSFIVAGGSGTIEGNPTLADAYGVATSGEWTLGPVPGVQQASARIESGAEVVFTALAFTADIPGEFALVRSGRIFVAGPVGKTLELLGLGAVGDRPAWSPDGRRIAFVSPGSEGDLYSMDADGSNPVRFRAAPSSFGFGAVSWSPDGQTLAVHYGDCVYTCTIGLLNANDPGTAPYPIAHLAAWPVWSPDGKKIAFVSLSGDDGHHALYLMNGDGSGVTELTLREGAIEHPTWSPDGQRIAFTKCLGGGGCDIYVVGSSAAAGTAPERLTTVGYAVSPAWSPDGFWIAFTAGSYEEPTVSLVPAAGGEPIPLIAGSAPAWRPRPPA